jgi:hypothetical protein
MPAMSRVASVMSLVVVAAAGALAAVAPLLPEGLVLGGSACGGGGSEQQCTGIARQLSLVEISPHAWLFVAGGSLCAVLGGAALVALWRDWSALVPIALVLAVVALVGLVAIEQVDVLVEPAGGGGGTIGRSLEDWGPFLAPELADMREDALRRYAGRPTAPGGPVFDREQILGSFSVREQDGWRLLRGAIVVGFFAALFAFATILGASLPLAITAAGTLGVVAWAVAYDQAVTCDPGASECYQGITTAFAIGLAVVWWVVYLVGAAIARRVAKPS